MYTLYIQYIYNSILLELTNDGSKVALYNDQHVKSSNILHTNINPANKSQDIYSSILKYKTLRSKWNQGCDGGISWELSSFDKLNNIQANKNNQCSCITRIDIVKMPVLSRVIHGFNISSIKILIVSAELEETNSKVPLKLLKISNS